MGKAHAAFAAILLLLLTAVPGVHAQQAQKPEPAPEPALTQEKADTASQAERVTVLQDKRINESSGLTRSLLTPGIFWTLNDSSGEPSIYAIDEKGVTRGKIRLPNAVNFDWEDLASARAEDGTPHLYIADIGDNLGVRPTITIYEIPEPTLPKDPGKEEKSAVPQSWHVSYPDGRHNAETLLVHPHTRRLYILTKREDGRSTLYRFPEKLVHGVPGVLQKLTDLSFPARQRLGKRPMDASQTTGGAISPDARRIAISTYSHIHEWDLQEGEAPETALQKSSRIIPLPLIPQMEALCYDTDSQTLWFTSERLPTPLWRIKRR